jgi:hypothetical protein
MFRENGFVIDRVRGPTNTDRWQVSLPDDPHSMIVQCHSPEAAREWCRNPQLYQSPQDPFWFFTTNEKGERLMMRVERAKQIARAIIEAQEKKNAH